MGLFDSWKVKVQTNLRNQVLYPGNIVEGFVEITASSPITFTAVRIKAVGKERVTITRTRSTGDPDRPTETETFRESCVVYKQLVTLAGHMKTFPQSGSFTMPQGTFYYPFSIQLPTNIPPSFSKQASNDYAEIVYYLKAYVDIPMGRDAVHRSHFTVLRPMPATQWAQKAPFSIDRNFDVTCCCCIDKGKVHARLFMDRTLIAIDRDNLQVYCEIDNTQGKEPVQSVEISLVNSLKYKASYVTEQNRVVAGRQFLKQEIPPGQKNTISGVIPLPRNIVPSLNTFNIQSDYTINIELNIPMASDPCQVVNVIVAQSVDDTNFSPPYFWQENKYLRLNKGQLSMPETFYAPPPCPVFQFHPVPIPPPMGAVVFQYNFTPPPLGLPSQMWAQQALPCVRGQQAEVSGQFQWQAGYGQAQCANTQPPPPLGVPPEAPRPGASSGGMNQPLLA
jgi:hypothetical protein